MKRRFESGFRKRKKNAGLTAVFKKEEKLEILFFAQCWLLMYILETKWGGVIIHHWFEMGVIIGHFYVFLKDCKKKRKICEKTYSYELCRTLAVLLFTWISLPWAR